MNRIKAFGAFWYDFVIGDDWRLAALVVVGLALTAILTHVAGVNAWWLLPVFVFAALARSLHKATTSKSLSRTSAPLITGPAPRRTILSCWPKPAGSLIGDHHRRRGLRHRFLRAEHRVVLD